MPRILFWNIQKFGPNSLFPPPRGKRRRGDDDEEYGEPAGAQSARDRLAVLLAVANAVQPDIISILEVVSGGRTQGQPVANDAAMKLLVRLRHGVNGNFRLVPPIVSGTGGRAEGIAVYYRDDNLHFVGPCGWSGAVIPLGVPGPAPALYPAPWDTRGLKALPNRGFPAYAAGLAPWLPAGCRENTLAGQTVFRNAAGALVQFPNAGDRRPWLTAFVTTAAPHKLIKLFSMHARPQRPHAHAAAANPWLDVTDRARGAVVGLASLPEITAAVGPNEVRCVVGDFNLSAYDQYSDPDSYWRLRNIGYEQLINPLGLVPPAAPPAPPAPGTVADPNLRDAGYFATHLRPAAEADPWISAGGQQRGYPGFGYVSQRGQAGDWYDSIDQAFVKAGAAAAVPPNTTVINPVTGSPYNLDPGHIPAHAPAGAVACASQMGDPALFHFAPPPPGPAGIDEGDAGADDATAAFREWGNYGKIRSLSDHLPICFEV